MPFLPLAHPKVLEHQEKVIDLAASHPSFLRFLIGYLRPEIYWKVVGAARSYLETTHPEDLKRLDDSYIHPKEK